MPSSVLSNEYDPIYDQVRGILGEHFEHFCFIVMNDKGEVYFDYDHLPSGRMLISEMHQEVRMDTVDVDWEDGWEEGTEE
jgi:hypothetical protein